MILNRIFSSPISKIILLGSLFSLGGMTLAKDGHKDDKDNKHDKGKVCEPREGSVVELDSNDKKECSTVLIYPDSNRDKICFDITEKGDDPKIYGLNSTSSIKCDRKGKTCYDREDDDYYKLIPGGDNGCEFSYSFEGDRLEDPKDDENPVCYPEEGEIFEVDGNYDGESDNCRKAKFRSPNRGEDLCITITERGNDPYIDGLRYQDTFDCSEKRTTCYKTDDAKRFSIRPSGNNGCKLSYSFEREDDDDHYKEVEVDTDGCYEFDIHGKRFHSCEQIEFDTIYKWDEICVEIGSDTGDDIVVFGDRDWFLGKISCSRRNTTQCYPAEEYDKYLDTISLEAGGAYGCSFKRIYFKTKWRY